MSEVTHLRLVEELPLVDANDLYAALTRTAREMENASRLNWNNEAQTTAYEVCAEAFEALALNVLEVARGNA